MLIQNHCLITSCSMMTSNLDVLRIFRDFSILDFELLEQQISIYLCELCLLLITISFGLQSTIEACLDLQHSILSARQSSMLTLVSRSATLGRSWSSSNPFWCRQGLPQTPVFSRCRRGRARPSWVSRRTRRGRSTWFCFGGSALRTTRCCWAARAFCRESAFRGWISRSWGSWRATSSWWTGTRRGFSCTRLAAWSSGRSRAKPARQCRWTATPAASTRIARTHRRTPWILDLAAMWSVLLQRSRRRAQSGTRGGK